MSAPKLTERIVAGLLRERHAKTGNGGSGEHAFFTQVRNGAGFDSNRTFDAVALNLWPSRGLALHVFEIKVSRSDWLRELKEPAKAEAACSVADHFCMVAPAGCVKAGELPDPWGLIEVTGNGDDKPWRLRTIKAAPKLHDHPTKTKPIDRSLLVSLLRSVPGAVPGGRLAGVDDAQLAEAEARGFKRGHDQATAHAKTERDYSLRSVQRVHDDAVAFIGALRECGVERFVSIASLTSEAPLIAAALAEGRVDGRIEQARTALRNALAALTPAAAVGVSGVPVQDDGT